MAVGDQPFRQSTPIPQDVSQPPAGDQSPAPFTEHQVKGPGGILRWCAAEVVRQCRDLGVGSIHPIQLIEQGLEGLHGGMHLGAS